MAAKPRLTATHRKVVALFGALIEARSRQGSAGDEARESVPDTTVTAYDMGRAHAVCQPDCDEDRALAYSGLQRLTASGRPTQEAKDFVRGFRSVDELTR